MTDTKQKEQDGGNPNRIEPDRARQERDEALEEVRKIRDQNERRARTHNSVEAHHEINVLTASGNEKAKPLELHAFGQRVYINSHGEAVLDQDAVITLRKALDQAFQAVS